MKNNVMLVADSKCAGCAACMNVCPTDAIKMQENREAFLMPMVDNDACVDCGKCLMTCPALHTKYENYNSPKIYAVMADDNTRMKSSSGGMFGVLANYFYAENGFVCGAAFDENFVLSHRLTEDPKELPKLQGSKYLQSAIGYHYREVKKALETGRKVLFTGTPCQVAGLKAFLGKEYDNLFTVDILCHGVPSQNTFSRYLRETLEKLEQSGKTPTLTDVKFRDKSHGGWKAQTIRLEFADDEPLEKSLKEGDLYEFLFHRNLGLRKSCTECPFSASPRQGDLSIGDFWGLSKIDKKMVDKKGTSLVIVNSRKGEFLLSAVEGSLKRCKEENVALEDLRNRVRVLFPANAKRDRFLKLMQHHTLTESVSFIKRNHFDVGLVSNFYAGNFGGAMTQIALYHVLEDLGYSTLMIERPASAKGSSRIINNLEKLFISNPYPDYAIAPQFETKAAMRALNDRCDTFVVGSDQLFQYALYRVLGEFVTLDWVSDDKKKIAYAASFGHDKIWGDQKVHSEMAYFIQKFDAFSVREESGVRIAKEHYGVDADWVLDPVYLCDPAHYHALASRSTRLLPPHYIGGYVLDPTEEKQRIYKAAMEHFQMPCEIFSEYNASPEYTAPLGDLNVSNLLTEERLQTIIHSDFFITDSFHGTCFAIIMKRPFISIMNKNRGASRFKSLLSMLHLEDRLIESEKDLDRPGLFDPIDYDAVYQILDKEKARCMQWLSEALQKPKLKAYSDYDMMLKLTSGQSAANYEQLLSRIEQQDQQIAALKQLILSITGNLSDELSDKTDIIDYLDSLKQQLSGKLVVVAVKDTPGLNLDSFIAHKLMDVLGLETDLEGKHSHSFVAVVNDGELVFEALGKSLEPALFYEKVDGHSLNISSRVYKNGNEAAILIDGKNYSVNHRGLNIVVFDKETNTLTDSVCFDTHLKSTPAIRQS